MTRNRFVFLLVMLYAIYPTHNANACRVNSDKFRNYAKKSVERLLDVEQLKSLYWSEEPLNEVALSKVTGLNIFLAETRFDLQKDLPKSREDKAATSKPEMLKDISITCSVNKDHSYTITLNLEIANPFKEIDLHYEHNDNSKQKTGLFRIILPQSTLLVQLNQRISYDECLDVNYVQLAPNVSYQVDCVDCTPSEQDHMYKVFSKRMTQLDSEINSVIGEKLLMGLQTLLSQQRFDLDLYMS